MGRRWGGGHHTLFMSAEEIGDKKRQKKGWFFLEFAIIIAFAPFGNDKEKTSCLNLPIWWEMGVSEVRGDKRRKATHPSSFLFLSGGTLSLFPFHPHLLLLPPLHLLIFMGT